MHSYSHKAPKASPSSSQSSSPSTSISPSSSPNTNITPKFKNAKQIVSVREQKTRLSSKNQQSQYVFKPALASPFIVPVPPVSQSQSQSNSTAISSSSSSSDSNYPHLSLDNSILLLEHIRKSIASKLEAEYASLSSSSSKSPKIPQNSSKKSLKYRSSLILRKQALVNTLNSLGISFGLNHVTYLASNKKLSLILTVAPINRNLQSNINTNINPSNTSNTPNTSNSHSTSNSFHHRFLPPTIISHIPYLSYFTSTPLSILNPNITPSMLAFALNGCDRNASLSTPSSPNPAPILNSSCLIIGFKKNSTLIDILSAFSFNVSLPWIHMDTVPFIQKYIESEPESKSNSPSNSLSHIDSDSNSSSPSITNFDYDTEMCDSSSSSSRLSSVQSPTLKRKATSALEFQYLSLFIPTQAQKSSTSN
jgi:hypothetical protein